MNHVEVWLRHNILRKRNTLLKLFKIYIELEIRLKENILVLLIYYNQINKNDPIMRVKESLYN